MILTATEFKPRTRRTAKPGLDRNSNEWAEYMRETYTKYVVATGKDKHWKGPCRAVVDATIADDVLASMNFMGSLVDDVRPLKSGRIQLRSRGYWAHGF